MTLIGLTIRSMSPRIASARLPSVVAVPEEVIVPMDDFMTVHQNGERKIDPASRK
jgi:hypothetical protein